MRDHYRAFFGLHKEPFGTTVPLKDILETPDIVNVKERIDYVVRLGAVGLVTGDIGSGKSTALRYAAAGFHPSEYRLLHLTATSGSILELYRQLLCELGLDAVGTSRAIMTQRIKKDILELLQGKKMKTALIIDEASLLRLEVLAEIHTLCSLHHEAFLPLILAGQSNLVDKLMYRSSLPLASRIIARSHLEGVHREGMEAYITHHLAIAGVKNNLFDETAITAINQGSGGLFRKANHLARGALIAAAQVQSTNVSAEHVRIASTETF
jgi:type II secretory pathway predicted ATPase ExeA